GDTQPMPAAQRHLPWRRIALIAGAVVLLAGGIVIGNSLARDESPSNAQPGPTSTTSTSAEPTSATTATSATPPATTLADTTVPSPDTTTTTTTTTTAAVASSDCRARFGITNSWPGGYQAQVTVRNVSEHPLTTWTVTWPRPDGHAISNLWNGTLAVDADSVTVTNLGHNGKVPAGGSTTFGFTANGPGTPDPELSCTSGG
ncbi:cellulose binding domain-containing protein, partial [Actinosynnema sp. NPDC023658]|uniref:cellulose binding domain-containing protein n=1 Tax=Actinosynnema sp. NPDC023658 TaxID=3155465 RepID=UPI0033EB01B7